MPFENTIHQLKHRWDILLVEWRRRRYSNSHDPRLIHTKLKGKTLLSLRAFPHDEYHLKPGEFLTLAPRAKIVPEFALPVFEDFGDVFVPVAPSSPLAFTSPTLVSLQEESSRCESICQPLEPPKKLYPKMAQWPPLEPTAKQDPQLLTTSVGFEVNGHEAFHWSFVEVSHHQCPARAPVQSPIPNGRCPSGGAIHTKDWDRKVVAGDVLLEVAHSVTVQLVPNIPNYVFCLVDAKNKENKDFFAINLEPARTLYTKLSSLQPQNGKTTLELPLSATRPILAQYYNHGHVSLCHNSSQDS
ncbi:uncharacterized protein CANTADRAFT_153147 [Suhomyces tanzawaensis NRRL Y-17324]|uniref:Uncharacterized protein n=1 Tax=Suhomyces tanzawaensis NRRL Y-17324 TaxID=984487 RepID=A0A1E4SME6_9ASCO|nr:uncharacterized protein CANTADRAFT_153147 [Suhomyces tanzawaensis NRRL Y-17324]ODV80552.1 hypothetical protein CANTADRAFT_153147 [Suhomyces tanzawaensis NRRL Y-17324]